MAEGDAEVLRRMYAAWTAKDLEAAVACFDDAVEFRTSGAFPGLRAVYVGRSGIADFWRAFHEMWEEIAVAPHHYIDTRRDLVALWCFNARGRGGIRVRRDGAHVARLRDGRIRRLRAYGDWRGPFDDVPAARPADVVRRAYVALNAADLAGMRDVVHPDAEFVPLVEEMEGSVYRGPEGMLAYREEMHGTWEKVVWHPERMAVREDGRVLAFPVLRCRGRDGLEVEQRAGVVVDVRDGRAWRGVAYGSEAEALAAAGRPR